MSGADGFGCGTVGVTTGTSGVTTVGIDMIHVVCGVVLVFGSAPVIVVVPVTSTVPVFSITIGSEAGIVVLLL